MAPNSTAVRADRGAPDSGTADGPVRTRWQKVRLVIKVVELRLRFVALMAATGLTFAYWDTIWNRYEKWLRPVGPSVSAHLEVFEFYCPMHPHVVQDAAGSCPICGMTLAKRARGAKPELPAGVTARVALGPSRVEQAGITTSTVAYEALNQTVTTVGSVAFDERGITTIVSKIPGKSRVEKLHVNVTGQRVEAGVPLAELYSPELSQAIEELLSAARSAGLSSGLQTEIGRSLANDRHELAKASAEKLRRWGLSDAQIGAILARGKADFAFPILAPRTGHVFKKNVVEGQEVTEGFAMFEVIDLDKVWVQAQVYEHQLGLVHEGQAARATVEAFPGEVFTGKLEFMQAHVDPATRTVDVRYAIENRGHRLRPGMFATVTLFTPVAATPEFQSRHPTGNSENSLATHASGNAPAQINCPVTEAKLGSMGEPIEVQISGRKVLTCCAACPPKLKAEPARYLVRLDPPPAGQVLSVPEAAVIDTGLRKLVYVESEPGIYDGREVSLGARVGDRFAVLDGLAPGDKVAVGGAFLIDAESRLNPAATAGHNNLRPAQATALSTLPASGSAPAVHRH
jgi:Cu(I)/Ag(I) efflux system membrane fusion protein